MFSENLRIPGLPIIISWQCWIFGIMTFPSQPFSVILGPIVIRPPSGTQPYHTTESVIVCRLRRTAVTMVIHPWMLAFGMILSEGMGSLAVMGLFSLFREPLHRLNPGDGKHALIPFRFPRV